jgi:thiol-disulfide isomerase/thioredoxin
VTRSGRFWAARWSVALLLAGVLAMWSACSGADHNEGVPAAEAELARLDYTLKDMDGKDVRLSDFKGRPLLINFWATWCAPCRAEIPAFIELVEKYQAEGFIVLGISIDDTPEQLQRYAAAAKVNYPMLVGLGHDDLLDTYEAYSVPLSWFVRRDGTVYLKKTGTESKEWFETQIKALF